MFSNNPRRCRHCYGTRWPLLRGDGKCSGCAGVGKTLDLSAPERECRECHGTGVCAICGGEGWLWRPSFGRARIRLFPVTILLFVFAVFTLRQARSRYLTSAEAAAELVHRDLSEGRVSQIYVNADEKFRMSMSFDDAVERLEAIRKNLGDCQYSGPAAWSVSTTRSGIYVVTFYHGRCTSGLSNERLTWHVVDGTARLVSIRAGTQAAPGKPVVRRDN